jgi:diguanylate cyclase (GGDEF)-like protein
VRQRAGGYLWIESTARAVHEPETGEIARMVLVMRDVTERKQAEEALRTLAVTDGLTGLQNRRAFDEALEDAWRETLLTGSQMALLMFDIDYFKRLNDSYGHLAGDDCLRAIAEVIKRTLPRAGCVAARYGGEELAVILRDADAEAAMQIAEAIRAGVQALRVPHRSCHEGGGFVSVSVGVAVAVSRHGGSMRMPESLLLSADNALYKAKRNGRNRLALSLVVASKAS